jgi:hypothetical protein
MTIRINGVVVPEAPARGTDRRPGHGTEAKWQEEWKPVVNSGKRKPGWKDWAVLAGQVAFGAAGHAIGGLAMVASPAGGVLLAGTVKEANRKR